MALAADLLELLVCPQCKGDLEYQADDSLLICQLCELGYPVKDDIPIMLIDLAHELGNKRQSGLTS
ncbi:Trm112 family protein [Candidatus Neomarinimicrobiota bacterium]